MTGPSKISLRGLAEIRGKIVIIFFPATASDILFTASFLLFLPNI